MKILVLGSGGREHALVWKLASDSMRPQIFCAPGNAGTSICGTNIDIQAEDIQGICRWCTENSPDLVVVGPEAPLCAGMTDILEAKGFKVFGPSKEGAMIEGSKVFAKEVMVAAQVPTAAYKTVTTQDEAKAYLARAKIPVVIKVEGLAAGKGVYVCMSSADVGLALKEIYGSNVFGKAAGRIVIEEYLDGEEASILALTDGKSIVLLDSAQDHKRVFNDDEGPNTGGMGAYSPAPVVTKEMLPDIKNKVFQPVVDELRKRGILYKGVLYAGLMITKSGVKVLEFNCRFGDPETQVILPRLDCDLAPALMACAAGGLTQSMVRWREEACVCVVMASGGYPGSYQKGKAITGLDKISGTKGLVIFHAGTKNDGSGIVTSGGRVLGVTALDGDLSSAIKKAYKAITAVTFDQAQYRTDIGKKALGRTNEKK